MRKGQVTMFMVLGVLLVILIVGGYFFVSEVGTKKLFAQETKIKGNVALAAPVQQFVESCLRQTAEEGIYYLGLQGGYYRPLPPFELYHGAVLPYYFYQGEERFPSIEDLEREHARYVRNHLADCVWDFSIFREQGMNVTVSTLPVVKTSFSTQTSILLNYPIEVLRDGHATSLETFRTEIDFNYQEIYPLLEDLFQDIRSTTAAGSFPLGLLADLAHEHQLTFELGRVGEDTLLVSLEFPGFTQPYIHSFLVSYGSAEQLGEQELTSFSAPPLRPLSASSSLVVFVEHETEAPPSTTVEFPPDYTVEKLQQEYGITLKGATGLDAVSVVNDQATIAAGQVELSTNNRLATIDLQDTVTADAQAYSGTITSTTGNAQLTFRDERDAAATITLEKGSTIRLENGKIVQAERITVAPEKDITLFGQQVSGFEFSYDASQKLLTAQRDAYGRSELFLNRQRFTSDTSFTAQLLEDKNYHLQGTNLVQYDSSIIENKLRSFTGGVTVLSSGYRLDAGTAVNEYVLGNKIAGLSVDKQTEYYPAVDYGLSQYREKGYTSLDEFVRKEKGMELPEYLNSKGCNGQTNCLEWDTLHNLRVVAKGESHSTIEVLEKGMFPSLTVDLITDGSTVTFTDHYAEGKDIGVLFSKVPPQVTNPHLLKGNLRTQIVSQYTGTDQQMKTFVLNDSLEHVAVLEDGNVDIVGYYSQWAIDNHYQLEFGEVMRRSEYEKYQLLYRQFREKFDPLAQWINPTEERFFILFAHQLQDDTLLAQVMQAYGQGYSRVAGKENPALRRFYLRFLVDAAQAPRGQYALNAAANWGVLAQSFDAQPYLRARFFESIEHGKRNLITSGHLYDAYKAVVAIKGFTYDDPIIFNRLSTVLEQSPQSAQHTIKVLSALVFDRSTEKTNPQKSREFIEIMSRLNEHAQGKNVDLTQPGFGPATLSDLVQLVQNTRGFSSSPAQSYLVGSYSRMYLDLLQAGDRDTISILNTLSEKNNLFVRRGVTTDESQRFVATLLHLRGSGYFSVANAIIEQNAENAKTIINDLHEQAQMRQTFVSTLPVDLYPFIIGLGVRGIGGSTELYRSSYQLVMDEFARKVGGYERIIPALEEKGFVVGKDPYADNFLLTVSSVGQFDRIMPADQERQKVYIRWLLNQFKGSERDELNKVGFSVVSLLRNERTRQNFEEVFFQEYSKVTDELTSLDYRSTYGTLASQLNNKKRIFQYWMLKNSALLSPEQLQVVSFDPEVVKAQEREEIPSNEWLGHATVSGGKPVVKGKVYFTSQKEESERAHFTRLRDRAREYGYLVTSVPDGYVLSKEGTLTDVKSGLSKPVRYQLEVTTNLDDVDNVLTSGEYSLIANRGHSFDRDEIIGGLNDPKVETEVRKLFIDGSCNGASASSKNTGLDQFDFVGTTGTGYGMINNDILLLTIEGMNKGITTYPELATYIKQNYHGPDQEELLSNYRFPTDFMARLLMKEES